MTLDVLADDGLLVLAGHVVPFDAVAVEIVQDGHAGLGLATLLHLLTVVGLTAWGVESEKKIKHHLFFKGNFKNDLILFVSFAIQNLWGMTQMKKSLGRVALNSKKKIVFRLPLLSI